MTSEDGRAGRTLGAALFVAIGALYAVTSARVVLGGDNGELVAAGYSGGIAHPPGYPLYLLLLSIARILPAQSPAHACALVTAAVATCSVATLAWAARSWGASRPASLFAAALYAASPLAWILGTHAEVFALNVLLATAIVGWSAPGRDAPLGREELRVFVLALLAGLGLANHHTIILLAPIGLYAVARAVHRSRSPWQAIGLGAIGLVVGLTPYLSIAWRAASIAPGEGCAWGSPRGLAGVIRHFLRTDYGTFQLAISDSEPAPIAHVTALAKTVFVDLFGAPLLVVVALLLVARRRSLGGAHVALALSILFAGPIFVSRFNLPPHGIAVEITRRFHLLPLALVAITVAPAIDVVLRARVRTLAPLFAVAFFGRAALSYGAVAEHHRPTIELWMRNVLRLAPERAVILHSGDDRTGAFMYARCALRLRPDVDAIAPVLLLTDWYPPQVSARLGIPIVHGERPQGATAPVLASSDLVAQLLATGRPVLATDWFKSNLDRTLASYPVGPLIVIPRAKKDVPDPKTLFAMNEEAFAKIELEPTLPEPNTWAGARMLDYARPWTVLANAFAARGDETDAATCRAKAKRLTPD